MDIDTACTYQPPASDVPVPSAWNPAPAPADSRDGVVEPSAPGSAWTGPQLIAWLLSGAITCTLLGTTLLA
jgi:hypothetical protein